MAPPLPTDPLRVWVQKNCQFALDVYYVSNLTEQELINLNNLINNIFQGYQYLQIVKQNGEDLNKQPWMTCHFSEVIKLKLDEKIRTMAGRYLRIIVAFQDQEQLTYIDESITKAANFCRLKFGFGAALERAEAILHHLKNNNYSRTSNPIIPLAYGNGRQGNIFYENSLESGFYKSEVVELNNAASILFDQAIEKHNSRHRFLFLWMALEAQLGDGKARKKFCEEVLQSEIISVSMQSLHKLRSDYAHVRYHVSDEEIKKACPELFELLRISAVKDGAVRKKLVKLFERDAKLKV